MGYISVSAVFMLVVYISMSMHYVPLTPVSYVYVLPWRSRRQSRRRSQLISLHHQLTYYALIKVTSL